MRDRMAGPENGLFFPIRPNKMLSRMKGGDKPDVSPLFSVENGRCIRIPLPGLSNTQRFIDATNQRSQLPHNEDLQTTIARTAYLAFTGRWLGHDTKTLAERNRRHLDRRRDFNA